MPPLKTILISTVGATAFGAGLEAPKLFVRETSGRKTPFFVNGRGHVVFDNQEGRGLIIGLSFTAAGGYKVMVRFSNETESNDLAVADARELATSMFDRNEPMHEFMRERLREHADKAEALNTAWEGDGRPADGFQGVVEEQKP